MFTNRETYLQWVQEWKTKYQLISAALKALRIQLSETHAVIDERARAEWVAAGSHGWWMGSAWLQSRQWSLRQDATVMLAERADNKRLSKEMKAANRLIERL